jgi:hypothetical protein
VRSRSTASQSHSYAERARLEATHAQAALEAEHQRALEATNQLAEHERARAQADLALELRRREAEVKDQEGLLAAQQQMRLAEIERMLVQGRVMHELVTEGLPKIAEALSQSFGTVHYTQIGNGEGGGPLQAVPAALAQLLALARSFGVELPAHGETDRGTPRT